MKNIVISGANIYNGGKLSIYQNILKVLRNVENISVVAFVYKKSAFNEFLKCKNINIEELPRERKKYFYRIYYEYYYYKKYSEVNKIDIWIAINDFTPTVYAEQIYSYYNNVLPFYKWQKQDIKYSRKEIFIAFIFSFIYRINIKKTTLIVQQSWIKEKFVKKYRVSPQKVIVARPQTNDNSIDYLFHKKKNNSKITFIYPVYPRSFKNHEIICEATKLLLADDVCNFEVIFTFEGSENAYAKKIYNKAQKYEKYIKFIGMVSGTELEDYYKKSHCLLFPSKLESWGLPITEAQIYGLDLIVSDLEYARETVGSYKKVAFFDCNDVNRLYKIMKSYIEGELQNDIPQLCGRCDYATLETLLKHVLDMD